MQFITLAVVGASFVICALLHRYMAGVVAQLPF